LAREHTDVLLDPVKAEAYIESHWGANMVSDRYDWLYSYDATTVEIA
jgi:salicylate hydroxylase